MSFFLTAVELSIKFFMTKKVNTKTPGYIWSMLNHKCPHCRKGDMFLSKSSYQFKNFMKMHNRCPVCSQKMEIEVGFYYGTGYVSYALTVAFSIFTFIAWWVLIGFSLEDNRLFWWIGINAVSMILLQPYFMRISRTIWLSFFIKYEKNLTVETENEKRA